MWLAAGWLFLWTLLPAQAVSAKENPLWLRYPAISPDGQTVVFNYKGDIYRVSSGGGAATPLTVSDSYEFNAVWSNDGKYIAFASDRYGNFDVFVMPATGGEAARLTYHSAGEIPGCFTPGNDTILFSAHRQDAVTNRQYPTGLMTELYSVPVNGGRVSQVMTTPALDPQLTRKGNRMIYHDVKGYENEWRKHHTSAVTRDVWLYDFTDDSYRMLSQFEGEDRNPVWDADEEHYYYLSEEDGSFNIYRSSLSDPATTEAVTGFEHHPVRFLSISDDNRLCYSYHGEVYTQDVSGEPEKLEVTVAVDGRSNLDKIVPVNKGLRDVALSPNGKEFAFVYRGEIFACDLEGGITKRITNTPYQERSVSFSPDGRSLLYAAEVDSSWNVYTTSMVREEEPYFFMSTVLEREPVIATDAEEFQPHYSPDGKEVAYLEERVILKVVNLESKETRTILPAKYNYSYADGDQYYQWSPDGKWFLVQFGQPERVMQDEVGLVAASGEGEVHNLTLSGYGDYRPQWEMEGKMMIYGSNRLGTRSESGSMTTGDVYGMFFTQEAFDRFQLSEEEMEVLKEQEKEEDEEDEGDDTKRKKRKKKEKDDDEEEAEEVKIEWELLTERKERLTTHTSRLSDWALSKDGEKLFYATRFERTYDIWVTDLRDKKSKKFATLGARRGAGMIMSEDGKFILVVADGTVKKVNTESGKVEPVKVNAEMILKAGEERAYIYDHSWRQLKKKFYMPDLHGVDWEFYYHEYKKFLPHINNNYDFAEMLSELLGETNASHTGARYRPSSSNDDETAALGVFYDYDHEGDGVKIAEVIVGGPMDKADVEAGAGDIIEKIDGVKITPEMDFYTLLNRRKGKYTLVSLYDPGEDKRWEEQVKPISLGAENQLLYERWVRNNRNEVEALSDGKLGYVHIRSMNDASMRVAYEESLGRHLSKDAIIVDTRFNGGGNIHEELSDFYNGEVYFDIIPHGQYVGSEPRDKWTKPSIVLMGESNYSDAHLFPMAYKLKGVGKTLGMPVPGTGTFVWWERQIDPTLVFGIPMGGWRAPDGTFMENNQMEPDIRVRNEPGVMAEGKDQQIEAAVEALLPEDETAD